MRPSPKTRRAVADRADHRAERDRRSPSASTAGARTEERASRRSRRGCTSVPPSAAPPETPSTNGSASGFRSRAWSATPARRPSAAPTIAASSARGRRSSSRMVWSGSTPASAPRRRDRLRPDRAGDEERRRRATAAPRRAGPSRRAAPARRHRRAASGWIASNSASSARDQRRARAGATSSVARRRSAPRRTAGITARRARPPVAVLADRRVDDEVRVDRRGPLDGEHRPRDGRRSTTFVAPTIAQELVGIAPRPGDDERLAPDEERTRLRGSDAARARVRAIAAVQLRGEALPRGRVRPAPRRSRGGGDHVLDADDGIASTGIPSSAMRWTGGQRAAVGEPDDEIGAQRHHRLDARVEEAARPAGASATSGAPRRTGVTPTSRSRGRAR